MQEKIRILNGIREELLELFGIDTSFLHQSFRIQRLTEISSHLVNLRCENCPLTAESDSDCLEPEAPCLKRLPSVTNNN
jgi:hypothetical protein